VGKAAGETFREEYIALLEKHGSAWIKEYLF